MKLIKTMKSKIKKWILRASVASLSLLAPSSISQTQETSTNLRYKEEKLLLSGNNSQSENYELNNDYDFLNKSSDIKSFFTNLRYKEKLEDQSSLQFHIKDSIIEQDSKKTKWKVLFIPIGVAGDNKDSKNLKEMAELSNTVKVKDKYYNQFITVKPYFNSQFKTTSPTENFSNQNSFYIRTQWTSSSNCNGHKERPWTDKYDDIVGYRGDDNEGSREIYWKHKSIAEKCGSRGCWTTHYLHETSQKITSNYFNYGKQNDYHLNFYLKKKALDFLDNFNYEITSWRNEISFGENSNRKIIHWKHDDKIKGQQAWYGSWCNELTIAGDEEIDVRFNLTKWNGMKISDFQDLGKALSCQEIHKDEIFKNLNIDESSRKIIIESDTMGGLKRFKNEFDSKDVVENRIKLAKELLRLPTEYQLTDKIKIKCSYGFKINENDDTKFSLTFKINKIFYDGEDLTDSFKKNITVELNNRTFLTMVKDCKTYDWTNKWMKMINSLNDFFTEVEVVKNIPIKFTESQIYIDNATIKSNLNFKYGKKINLNNLSKLQDSADIRKALLSQVVDDRRILITPPNPAKHFGGKWLVFSPVEVEYTLTNSRQNFNENEILLVNGERIPVLNGKFKYHMKDMRKNASDNERVALNEEDKHKPQNELDEANSRLKNEYVVEVQQFREGSNNHEPPIFTYKVNFIIVEQVVHQQIKYFAWNPEIHPEQKKKITEFETDDEGNTKFDDDGQPIKNPYYDPEIDPQTGTKKQMVWIPKGTLSKQIVKDLSFWYPNLDDLNDFGIFAEAQVLGKGALRNLKIDEFLEEKKYGRIHTDEAQTKFNSTLETNYFMYQLYSKSDSKWITNHTIKDRVSLTPKGGLSPNAYMSYEGIWLLGSNINSTTRITPKGRGTQTERGGTISNLKLVLIDEDNQPFDYFLDSIKKYKDSKNRPLDYKFENFWTSYLGRYFIAYLGATKHMSEEIVTKLPHEELHPLYDEWVKTTLENSKPFKLDNSKLLFDFRWSELTPFRGQTNKQKLKQSVEKYIDMNMSSVSHTKNLVKNKDWFIKEFSNINEETDFLDELSKVYIYNSPEFENYKGVKLTLLGKGKYALSKKELYFRNEAWHIYEPPIDLSKLKFEKEHLYLKINKDDFATESEFVEINGKKEPNPKYNDSYIDSWNDRYIAEIESEIFKFLHEQLDKYTYKYFDEKEQKHITISSPPIWLTERDNILKDVKIANLSNVLAFLARGKVMESSINLELVGVNDNLLNKKIIKIRNDGDGGKFHLKNLTKIFLDKPIELVETSPEAIAYKIKKQVVDEAETLKLKLDEDYSIFMINYWLYFLDLVADIKELEKVADEDFLKKLTERKNFITKNSTFDYEGTKRKVQVIPPSLTFEKLMQSKNKIIKLYENNIYNNNLRINIFSKLIVVCPITKKTEGFAYINALNQVRDDYRPDLDPEWINLNPDKINDFKGNKLTAEEVVKSWWFGLLMTLLGLAVITGTVFLIKFIYSRYGGTFGKRPSKPKSKKDYEKEQKRKTLKQEANLSQNNPDTSVKQTKTANKESKETAVKTPTKVIKTNKQSEKNPKINK